MSWDVGGKAGGYNGRTVHSENGDLVGMMDTPALAKRVVDALNAADAPKQPPEEREPLLRVEVLAFASLMEKKLRENDHKGGWQGEDKEYLLRRLTEEMGELERAATAFVTPSRGWRDIVGSEAADVANFAMMIADNCGALRVR